MPLNISVTKRELKNKSGVALSVGSYDPAPSPKQVKNYHVVVITRLPFFKRPEHSEEDVVQFMIRRDYAAFEQLQRDILLAFPELKLPGFPRKFHVFMSESDVEERMVSFDCIVKLIAQKKEMCCSPPMLEFLGFSLLAEKEYFKARRKCLQKQHEEIETQERKNQLMFGDRLAQADEEKIFEEESNEDMFKDESQTRNKPFAVDSIFEDTNNSKKSTKISIMQEEDDILMFGEKSTNNAKGSSLLDELEDHSELLDVSDTLDDVLKIADSKKRNKPHTKKVTSLSSSSKTDDLFGVDDEGGGGVEDMGTDDIMKYIQQNQATDEDDLDLF